MMRRGRQQNDSLADGYLHQKPSVASQAFDGAEHSHSPFQLFSLHHPHTMLKAHPAAFSTSAAASPAAPFASPFAALAAACLAVNNITAGAEIGGGGPARQLLVGDKRHWRGWLDGWLDAAVGESSVILLAPSSHHY